MIRSCLFMTAAFVALVVGSLGVPKACAITIDMVTVGNPGNANDPDTGNLYGRVGYSYQIGKYNVTIAQYVAFLKIPTRSTHQYRPSCILQTESPVQGQAGRTITA